MEKLYKCVKEFSVGLYDEHERLIEGEFVNIPLNSLWEHEEDSYSTSELRLEGDANWIDICRETLAECFVEV